jgi:tetratricopeptide (TPR) repeat protein
LLLKGDKNTAQWEIETAYRSHPKLYNGYARCAFALNCHLNYEPKKALPWFELDRRKRRMKGQFQIHYASLLASIGDFQRADKIVKQAYKKDRNAKNGLALIGWYYYNRFEHRPDRALTLFNRDKRDRRLLSSVGGLHAGLYAYLGERKRAEAMVSNLYEFDKQCSRG